MYFVAWVYSLDACKFSLSRATPTHFIGCGYSLGSFNLIPHTKKGRLISIAKIAKIAKIYQKNVFCYSGTAV